MAQNTNTENLTWLYDTLTKDGVELGTFEQTAEAIRTDEGSRRWLYDTGVRQGIKMGSYEEFEEAMGLPKFQAPLLYGETPKDVKSAQPAEVVEEDLLTSDMPEEEKYEVEKPEEGNEEPTEEYGLNRDALKSYVPEFKSEIKEKFPNARLIGFTNPGFAASAAGIDPYLTGEERQKKDALAEQLKLGQINKEQYQNEVNAVYQQAADRFNADFSDDSLNASAALHLMTKAQNKIKMVDSRTDSKVGNFFRGVKYADYAGINPAMQFVDAYQSFSVLNKLADNPDAELSESEEYLLQAIVTNNAVDDNFQANMAERIGQGLPQNMAYMAQFALTGGAGSLVGGAAKKGVQTLIKKGMKNAERRLYAKGFKGLMQKVGDRVVNTVIPGVVGASAAAATQTVLDPIGLASGTLERAAGTAEYGLTADGAPVATGEVTDQQSLGESFKEELLAKFAENVSERSGESLGVLLGGMKAVGRTAGKAVVENVDAVRKVADKVTDLADMAKKSKVGDMVGRAANWLENKDFNLESLARAVGWNGTVEEFYEEQVNTVLNAMLVGDEEFSSLMNSEKQLETLLSVGIVGGSMRLLSAPAAIADRAKVRSEKQNLKSTVTNIEKRMAGNQGLSSALKTIADAVDNGTVEDIAIALAETNRQLHLDKDTAQAFLDYASARSMLNMWRSNDRRQASKLAEEAYAETEARTHKQTGAITVAEYTNPETGNVENVDIIDGVIIRNGQAVDSTLSDRSVVVRMQDGSTKMVPSKTLGNVVQEINPVAYRSQQLNDKVKGYSSEFSTEYSSSVNKYGVHYNDDGTLDYYNSTPGQIAVSLVDEKGGVQGALEYAAEQRMGLQGAQATSAEGGEGFGMGQTNALSKWQTVEDLLSQMAAKEVETGTPITPEEVTPAESAEVPAKSLRPGDRVRLTVDSGEVVEATIGARTPDGEIVVDFDELVSFAGNKGQSLALTPEQVAAAQYVEQIQEGEEELEAEQSPELSDVDSFKSRALGRIPVRADGSRDWEAATPMDAATAKVAELDGDFDAALAFAQEMAENTRRAAEDLSAEVISVDNPADADALAAAKNERSEQIASMQKTSNFWQEVANNISKAKASSEVQTAETVQTTQETTTSDEEAMPMLENGEPDFVSAGVERTRSFLNEQLGEAAGGFVQTNIAEAEKALAEATEKKPTSTGFSAYKQEADAIAKEREEAQARLDFWAQVATPAQSEVVEEAQPAEVTTEVEETPAEVATEIEEIAQPEEIVEAEAPTTATEEAPEMVEETTEVQPEKTITQPEAQPEQNNDVVEENTEKDTNFVEESETTPQETIEEEITAEMIENSNLDEEVKLGAIAYLNGDVNMATELAYEIAKNYVRNNSTERAGDSTNAGSAQLGEGVNESDTNASEQSRGNGGDLDSRENDGTVSDSDGVRSETGENDLAEPSGSGSDRGVDAGEPNSDEVSGGSATGSGGSSSDSERRPTVRNTRRRKGGSNGLPNENESGSGETKRGGNTPESASEVGEKKADDLIAEGLQELKDIFANPMGDAKGALLDATSLLGMFGVNAIKIMGASAKIGIGLIKKGYYKLKKWRVAMHDQLDEVLRKNTQLTDELIDDFINAMWDYPFRYRGEVRKISEWASLLEAEELRAMMRMSIEEKRKLQQKAESEPTILADIDNIRKSLPFLLPAQQEDVEKAEFQFFDESHKDAAYGYGKGYMFTNGTGTGKTYTGLGIIKRFIKQGKGRILIVTASGEKIDDWVKDAKNLGITATRLADTKSKGEGVVVTQFANLRQNYELLKDEFDLIVYDESHKLMENQGGLDTRAAAAHYMITNRDVEQAIARTLQDTPLWKEPRMLEEELDELTALLDAVKMTSEQLKRAEQLGGKFAIEQRVEYIKARLTELVKLQEAEIRKQLQDPAKRAEAEAAVARTKVVFLSATPFNTALNLDYVEGYIFSYPTDESGERDREKDKERFVMDKFPSSHRRGKNTVVRMDERNISDPDAATAEEIAFSDYLQNTLHTMSGRGLDSEWDYSREFPKLSIPGARLVNAAIAALTTGKYNALRPYFKHLLDDYAQSTAFFEVIKTSASIERIREHIALGRKVVVFHRRMTSKEPMEPPFAKGLENADYDKNAPAEMIARFRQEFAELLAWEQSLDYRFPQDILMEAFASAEERAAYKKEMDEYGQKLLEYSLGMSKSKKMPKEPKLRSANVGVFNGQETEAEKHKAVEAFNTDGSKCNLLVVQVAAGKEGISLHDKTGKHQRVMMSMQLPQSPIEFVQAEGRIYRVGNQSNAIFEYPLLGIDQEVIGFAAKINGRAATTENLALGSRARGLRNSISRAVLASREIPVTPTQGVGGKQLDSRDEWEKTDYDGAIAEYNARASEEKTTDFNEQETPEPIGYKMMEWARAEAGESILEPAAGTGTMAQYAPQKSRLTAIEIITQKFATLITKIGGSGRKLLNEDFMGFSKNNKFDCVVMNSPHYGAPAVNATIAPQGVPQGEYEFLEKAFGHINEGGRVVALLEEKSADATIEVVTGAPSRVFVGEVKLPAFAFPNGKAGVATRVVVFDVVSNATLREAMPEKVTYDLSNVATPQDLFKALRDVQMPARTIDKVFRLGKKMQKFEAKFKEFKNFIMKRKNYFTGKMEPEVDFTPESAYLRVRTAQGSKYYFGVKGYYFRLQINGARIVEGDMGEISRLCKQYQDIKSITDLDPVKDKDEFRRLTSNGNSDVYPEISEFLKVCQDAIRTALGKTEAQIKNIAEGRVENELRGDLTLKQMKDAFEGLSHGDVTLEDLSKKVFEAVGKIEGLRFYTKQGMNPSEVAYYSPRENAIVINEDTWNSLRWTDSFKAQTVVHEMIHAVTSYYIHAYELGASFSEEINQACQDILEVYKAISTDEGFRAGLRQRSGVHDNAEYGLTSATEMIAELANPLFRAQLKVKKLWRQLVNGIKKLLGINLELGDATETTALETLESALDTLLSNYDPDAYAAWVEVNRGFSDSMEVRDMMTSEQISADYPNWLEGTTTDSGKHTTQVEGTRKTYREVGKWIAENMGMDTSILDASSGMGYGTQDLRAEGFNVEDVEPYQSESRKQSNPATYSSYDDIEKEYDFIISNAVLNVIPDDWRADVLHNMAAHLKEGGKMFINTRKAGEEKAIKDKIELDSAQEVLVKRNGQIASYQKFFTPSELKEYVESELGEGYTVEVANLRNSGTSGLAAVIVTKNNEGSAPKGKKSQTEEEQIIAEAKANGTYLKAPNGKPTNLTPKQWVEVRTKAFKKWFGDWTTITFNEDGSLNIPNDVSKVVDANGEPMVVYHGSNWKGITTFDRSKSKRRRSGLREYGHFFTTNRALAELYSAVDDAPEVKEEIARLDAQIDLAAEAKDINKMLDLYTEKERITRNLGGRVYEVFLNLRDVAEFDADYQADKGWYNLKADVGYKTAIGRDAMEAYAGLNGMTGNRLRKDGIIGRNIIDLFVGTENKEALKPYFEKYGGDVFLAFDAQNIKSATENVGTFDVNNSDIRYRTKNKSRNLPASEYAALLHTIMTRQHIYKRPSFDYVLTAGKFYVYDYLGDSNFSVKFVIPITGNEDVIRTIYKSIDNGTVNSSRSLDTVIEEIRSGERGDIAYNSNALKKYQRNRGVHIHRSPRSNNRANRVSEVGHNDSRGFTPGGTSRDANAGFGERERITIAAQAETLSRAEVEEYAKSLAEVAPEGVKVVVTNSAESGDTEHSGWYDMSTDTVYINADLCENEADVDATFAHELVGHRAMPSAIARVIGRRNVTDRIALYTKLAMMLPQELLDRVMAKTADNMDLGTAVDEVLAEEVENANIIKPSLWRRICAEVRALFRKVLNRGLMMSDNDIKYMFWLAANNINSDAEYLKADEVLHRIGAGRYKKNSAVGTEEQKEYDEAVVAKSQRLVENWVDSLNPVKKLQEAVAKAHGPLKPFENAYDIELGRASRTMARFNMMAERYLKPVITAISSLTNNGTTLEDVKNYMIAKHGLERNAYYREEKRKELNKSILDFIKEVATDSIYSTLSIPEKVAVVKNQFDNISAHIDFAEVANALEFAKDSPGVDYMSNVVSIEAVPLKDMSGLTGLTEKLAPHLDAKKEFTSFAESLIGDFEALYITSVDTLWEKVRDLSTATLLYQVEGGIISREQYNHLRSMYKYYIPLRGWDGENSSDFYEYSTTPSRYQTVVKSASGRESLADDPLANLANMLQSAVTIVEKNAAKQALVRMAMNRPDSNLVKVVRVRYEKRSKGGKTVWEPVYPDIPDNATPSDVDSIIEEFEEETKQLVAAKEARVRRSQIEVGVRVLPTNKKDHYVKAMFNGEEVAVVISGSPAAALALNGLNAPDYDRALEETLGRATRFFAKTHTAWAPKFVLTNFMRDFGYSSFAAYTKYGARYAAAFERNIVRAGWKLPKLLANGISNLTAEQLDDFSQIDQQTLRYFAEFLTNGGETGFSQALSTEEWKKEIDSQISALQGGSPKKAIKGLLKLLESANRYAEDIPRFAAYLTSRESGKGITDSIKDAKEITVNFSRHGAGGMGNSLVRKSYAFVNAGIQGAYNLITLAKENPQRFWLAASTIFLSGFGLPFLNMLLISAFGDDDDERNYKYMTEFNNTNRLVVFNPLGEKHGFITLPISHELVPFYGLGNIAARRMMGMDADLSLTEQVASAILSIAPLDFISSSAQGVNVRSVIPSAVQPVYDIFENKDYMGRPIYRSYDYGSGNTNRWDAAFTKAPVETWSWLVELSRLTSMATGGDGIIKPGMADFHLSNEDHDVQLNNPAIAQYLVESYLGGSVQSVTKVINLVKGIIASRSGDETNAERYLAAYNLPLVSGLYRFSNETSADSRIKEAYDHYKNDIAKQCERAVKRYMKELPADVDMWPKAALDVLNSTDYQIYQLFKDYDKPIRTAEKSLEDAYDRNASKATIDLYKQKIMAAKMELIEAASDIQLRGVATKMQDNN